MNILRTLWNHLNEYATHLLVVGLGAAILWNWRQWRQDRALALRLQAMHPASPAPLLPSPQRPCPLPKVSVLVAAWNEAAMIQRHIQSFLGLRYPDKELVLCAGGEDGTYDLACPYAGEQVIVLEQRAGEGKQRALQRCLEYARGEVLFLSDADCLLDEESFERTLQPLLDGREVAASGASQPLPEQQSRPFVLHQWCADLYVQAHTPDYIAGLLGRNCAVRREALQAAGGFTAPVSTGTDYYLAKRLLRAGYAIRWVRDSVIATRYPDTWHSLWRRQSRWLRNLLLHGPRLGAYQEVWMALRTSLAGWAMLLLPFLALVTGPVLLALWAVLLAHAFLAKMRYARFAHWYQGIAIARKQYALTPLYLFVDFIAWAMPLVDLLLRRHEW